VREAPLRVRAVWHASGGGVGQLRPGANEARALTVLRLRLLQRPKAANCPRGQSAHSPLAEIHALVYGPAGHDHLVVPLSPHLVLEGDLHATQRAGAALYYANLNKLM